MVEYEIHIVYGEDDVEYYAGADTLEELAIYIRQCTLAGDKYRLYKVTREALLTNAEL